MTEDQCRQILDIATASNYDPFTIVQQLAYISKSSIKGVTRDVARKVAINYRYSAEHIYDAMRCCEQTPFKDKCIMDKLTPCEVAMAMSAWNMAIQAKLNNPKSLESISVEELALQYGKHISTRDNIELVSHFFNWDHLMDFINE